jgi:hypothetical protein
MATIHQLKPSITDLTPREALELIVNSRNTRLEPVRKRVSRRAIEGLSVTPKAKRKSKTAAAKKPKTPAEVLASLTPEERKKLLETLNVL